MAVIVKLKSGNWRAQVRYKGRYASQTFKRKDSADAWVRQAQDDIDKGKTPTRQMRTGAPTFGDLIDLHLQDMADVGAKLQRSKENVLRRLKDDIGVKSITQMNKADPVALAGAAPRKGARSVHARDIAVISMDSLNIVLDAGAQ